MRNEARLSLDIERDWTWEEWPDEARDQDSWEDEGLTVTEGPHQVVME